jgi:hypothetical protein
LTFVTLTLYHNKIIIFYLITFLPFFPLSLQLGVQTVRKEAWMKYRRASFFFAALVIGLSPPGYAAVPPFPLPGTAFYVSVKGEWFSLSSLPESSLEIIPAPEEGILLRLPGKPFPREPRVCLLGKPWVLIPFPEVPEGGFPVD